MRVFGIIVTFIVASLASILIIDASIKSFEKIWLRILVMIFPIMLIWVVEAVGIWSIYNN